MNIELPDGRVVEFPDDMDSSQIESALNTQFQTTKPQEYKKPSWQDVLQESLKQRNPSFNYAKEVQQARETPLGMALELPLFFAAPEAEIPALGRALGKYAPNLVKGIQAAIPQGILTGALSPDESLKRGLESTAVATPLATLGYSLTQANPTARAIGRLGAITGIAGLSEALIPSPLKGLVLAGEALGGSMPGTGNLIRPSRNLENKITSEFLENLMPTSRKPEINQLYKKSYFEGEIPTKITQEFRNENAIKVPKDIFGLKGNEIFKEAEKSVQKSGAYREKLKGVDKNSVEYLDAVKKRMDAMIRGAKRGENPDFEEAAEISKVKDALVEGLSNFSPKYSEARNLAQRNISRRNIEGFMNKGEGKSLTEYLKNIERTSNLEKSLINAPQAKEQFGVLKSVFQNLQTPELGKSLLNPAEFIRNYKYESDLTKLANDPIWMGRLREALNPNRAERITSGLARGLYPLTSYGLSQE